MTAFQDQPLDRRKLLGTMLVVANGANQWVWGYVAYSVMNALSAWLILSQRI